MSPGKPAARITDAVAHPLPPVLTGGPVSPNVIIGGMPAWLGVNAQVAAVLKQAKQVADQIVGAAEKATAAATGPAYPAAKAAEEAIKASVAASMGSMISGMAAGGSIHACTTPYPPIPHGPGVVVDASTSVQINYMPACFLGNQIIEALGPPNKIAAGCPTVMIGAGSPSKVSVDPGQIKAKMEKEAAEAGEKAKKDKEKEMEEEEKKKQEAEAKKQEDD